MNDEQSAVKNPGDTPEQIISAVLHYLVTLVYYGREIVIPMADIESAFTETGLIMVVDYKGGEKAREVRLSIDPDSPVSRYRVVNDAPPGHTDARDSGKP